MLSLVTKLSSVGSWLWSMDHKFEPLDSHFKDSYSFFFCTMSIKMCNNLPVHFFPCVFFIGALSCLMIRSKHPNSKDRPCALTFLTIVPCDWKKIKNYNSWWIYKRQKKKKKSKSMPRWGVNAAKREYLTIGHAPG